MIEIWSEGFSVTGQSSGAIKLGTFKADSFNKAVKVLLEEKPDINKYYKEFEGRHFYWGCKLFDNEADAR